MGIPYNIYIDADNPLSPTYGEYETALTLKDEDKVFLAEGSQIATYGYGSIAVFGGYRTYMNIKGTVYSDWDMGILTNGTISVGTTGKVTANKFAIQFYHDQTSPNLKSNLINDGEVTAQNCAVAFNGPGVVRNNGKISANYTAIEGSSSYESSSDESFMVINKGLISAETAIFGMRNIRNWIENYGTIKGDVILGDNRDYYYGVAGTVSGVVYLNGGDDIAEGGNGNETMFGGSGTNLLSGGAGTDTLIFSHLTSSGGYRDDLVVTVDLAITGDKEQRTTLDSWDVISGFENVVGNSKGDFIYGDNGRNGFKGRGGNDLLDGRGGDDQIEGGAGNDRLFGGTGTDVATFSGKSSDYTVTANRDGTFTIADKRGAGDGIDTLTGIEFAAFSDRLLVLAEIPKPGAETPIKNLSLNGNRKADKLAGGKGHDKINGGLGSDVLTGGAGKDVFVFNAKLGKSNVDRITDFHSPDDTIHLSRSIFSKIEKGFLKGGAFYSGIKARDKNDRIGYDKKSGDLYYDADGSGTKFDAVKFAQLKAGIALKAVDFLIA